MKNQIKYLQNVFYDLLNDYGQAYIVVRHSDKTTIGNRGFTEEEKKQGLILIFNQKNHKTLQWTEDGSIITTLGFGAGNRPEKCFLYFDDIVSVFSPDARVKLDRWDIWGGKEESEQPGEETVPAEKKPPDEKITLVVEKGTPLVKSFAVANDVLKQAVQGISDIILIPGLINVDFADVRTIIQDKGRGVMGSGVGRAETGALDAAKKAILNPLLEESSIEGSKGILVNITGGLELSLNDVQEAVSYVYDSAHEDVHLIFGAVLDPDIGDEVRVTVIATGFSDQKEKVELPQVKKWTPVKQPVNLRGSERVLSKSLKTSYSVDVISTDIMPYEDHIDVPTFLRKSPQPQKEV